MTKTQTQEENTSNGRKNFRYLLMGMLASACLAGFATWDYMHARCERKLFEQRTEIIRTTSMKYFSAGCKVAKKLEKYSANLPDSEKGAASKVARDIGTILLDTELDLFKIKND